MNKRKLLTKLESGTLCIEADRHRYREAEIARHEEEIATEMIKIAVKKQIEENPITTIGTKMVKGKITGYPIYHCSECSRKLSGTFNYCPLCGQKIEWSNC